MRGGLYVSYRSLLFGLMQRHIAMQDKVHKDYKDTPAIWSMCWMNFWCSLYNCVYLFVVTSAGWDLLSFCREFPEVSSSFLATASASTHTCIGDAILR